VITFPFLLLLWDYWPLQGYGPLRRAIRRAGTIIRLTRKPGCWYWKDPASAVIRRQRRDHDVGSNRGVSRQDIFSIQLSLAAGNGAGFVREISGKGILAAKLVAMYPHPTELYPICRQPELHSYWC